LIDDQSGEEISNRRFRRITTTRKRTMRSSRVDPTRIWTIPRRRNRDSATSVGEPEPEEVCDERDAWTIDCCRCVEAVAALAYWTTVSYAERGTGPGAAGRRRRLVWRMRLGAVTSSASR
jgi:hypothetical protein